VRVFIEGYDQPGLSKSTWKSEDGNPLIFDALLAGKHPIELKRDTVAELTGVVRALMNDERKPAGLELYLRSPAGIAVLSTPSFWTAARMWRIVGSARGRPGGVSLDGFFSSGAKLRSKPD